MPKLAEHRDRKFLRSCDWHCLISSLSNDCSGINAVVLALNLV
jgi:hypothetical protein